MASLERLGLEYLDLYLLHWPVKGLSLGCWRELEGFFAEGLAKGIGVCNFSLPQLDWLMGEAQVRPMANQIELHPHLAREALAKGCLERGVAVTSYSPLARGRLSESQNLIRVASRHHKTVSQVILRWHLQKGYAPIPKAGEPARIRENLGAFDFSLPLEDMRILDRQDQGRSIFTRKLPADEDGFVIEPAPGEE